MVTYSIIRDVVAMLTLELLSELGVSKIGHRLKIMKYIQNEFAESEPKLSRRVSLVGEGTDCNRFV